MNKSSSVGFSFAGTGGIDSVDVTQKNDSIECGFFKEYDENNNETLSKLAQIEANKLKVNELQKQIDKLNQRIQETLKANNQIQAEIQLYEKKDKNGLGIHEKHAFAQWCFLSHYSIDQFCKLYYRALPDNDLPLAFSKKYRELVGLMRKQVEPSETGKRTLCLHPENDQGYFPIEAYRVLCQRIGLRVDLPVFSWRECYDLEDINAEYYERVSKRGRELFEKENRPRKEVRKRRLEESDEKMTCVFEALEENNYSFRSKGDLYSAVALKAESKGLIIEHNTASDWTKKYCKFNGVDLDHDIDYWGKTRKSKKRILN